MKINIIGAGLSGLSAFKYLSEKHSDIQIFEKQNKIGGYVSSYEKDGYTFDLSGHFLHFKNDEIKKWILTLMNNKLKLVERKALIYSSNTFTQYPYQSNFFGLPNEIIKENLLGLIKAKYDYHDMKIQNFYDWIIKYFGKGIAKNFMIPYNTKLWSVHPKKMNTTWMGRFVPDSDLEKAIEGSFSFETKHVGYNPYFHYPKEGGIKELPIAIAKESNPDLKLNSEIIEIDLEQKIIINNEGEKFPFDVLINTMPLDLLISRINNVSHKINDYSKQLKKTYLVLINLGVDENLHRFNWCYFPEKKYDFFRLGFYSNSSESMAPRGKSSMYVEVSFPMNKQANFETIYNNVIDQLIKIKLISDKKLIEIKDIQVMNPSYIVPDLRRDFLVNEIQSYLRTKKVYSIGRYGNWEYSAMEDAILGGKEASKIIG